MISCVRFRKILFLQLFIAISFLLPLASFAQPANNPCGGATVLTPGTTCSNTAGTLLNATATAGILAYCGNAASADVWYKVTATTSYPTITLSSVGATFTTAGVRIQIFTNVR